jgi:hypothetical protein
MSSDIFPRCLNRRDGNPSMPRIVNSDCTLRPCSLHMPLPDWRKFVDWCTDRSVDAESDLSLLDKDAADVMLTPTWKILEDGFTNGDPGPVCKRYCSYEVLFPKRHTEFGKQTNDEKG